MKHSMIIHHARVFQMAAHSACGQVRKHSGKPYHTHPQDVVEILIEHIPNVSQAVIAAAYLHDVIEDTKVSLQLVQEMFGSDIANMVDGLTKKNLAGKREIRFRAEVRRLALTSVDVKTIKIADSIANIRDYIQQDRKYAREVYLPEKRILLDSALKEGDSVLWALADSIINEFYKEYQT